VNPMNGTPRQDGGKKALTWYWWRQRSKRGDYRKENQKNQPSRVKERRREVHGYRKTNHGGGLWGGGGEGNLYGYAKGS